MSTSQESFLQTEASSLPLSESQSPTPRPSVFFMALVPGWSYVNHSLQNYLCHQWESKLQKRGLVWLLNCSSLDPKTWLALNKCSKNILLNDWIHTNILALLSVFCNLVQATQCIYALDSSFVNDANSDT